MKAKVKIPQKLIDAKNRCQEFFNLLNYDL